MQGNENGMAGKREGGRERERARENDCSRARLHMSDARTSIAVNRSSVHGGEDLAAGFLHHRLAAHPSGNAPA